MKTFSYIIVLLIGFNGFSQLYQAKDSKIVVKNEVLFVENNIHLNDTIYFRDEAQLIQGSGNTGNSGTGMISIYQEGNVNAFSYNFWSAPVGNVDNDVSGNTDFRLNLIDDPMLATPDITDSQDTEFTLHDEGTSNPLTISEKWVYTYASGNEYTDWVYAGSEGAIKTGQGFSMKGMGTGVYGNQTYDFRGKPNNGDVTNAIDADSQTLMGNPYPSALDSHAFLHNPTNTNSISGSIYYWEQAPGDGNSGSHLLTDYVGGYATYTISSDASVESFTKAVFNTYDENGNENSSVGSSSSSKIARRYIPIGQGFVVEASSTGGEIKMDNSQRVYYKESGTKSEFFKLRNNSNQGLTNGGPSLADNLSRLRIYVDFDKEYSRELLMNFHPSFTEAFEYGLESESPEGIPSDAYWMQDQQPMVIKALNFNSAMKIPLVVILTEQMDIRVRLANLENFGPSQNVFINDRETGKYYSIRNGGYTFTNIEPGIYSERFFITFQDLTLSDREVLAQKIKIFVNYEKSVLTILNPELLDINEVRLFDLKGSAVMDNKNIGKNDKYEFNLGRLSDGVYVASLRLEQNQKVNQKLMVKKLR
ncbi:Por secretion system C-terminal sorting domain-containing protein [Flavobacteriaceae bacterium MAR_2010_188]|nr:Por secretion system C-terminal sorting domain-containing protein [Flavobacteriaceae bacterium MAR_2010_188]